MTTMSAASAAADAISALRSRPPQVRSVQERIAEEQEGRGAASPGPASGTGRERRTAPAASSHEDHRLRQPLDCSRHDTGWGAPGAPGAAAGGGAGGVPRHAHPLRAAARAGGRAGRRRGPGAGARPRVRRAGARARVAEARGGAGEVAPLEGDARVSGASWDAPRARRWAAPSRPSRRCWRARRATPSARSGRRATGRACERPGGFGIFNPAAVAARHLRRRRGLGAVLVVESAARGGERDRGDPRRRPGDPLPLRAPRGARRWRLAGGTRSVRRPPRRRRGPTRLAACPRRGPRRRRSPASPPTSSSLSLGFDALAARPARRPRAAARRLPLAHARPAARRADALCGGRLVSVLEGATTPPRWGAPWCSTCARSPGCPRPEAGARGRPVPPRVAPLAGWRGRSVTFRHVLVLPPTGRALGGQLAGSGAPRARASPSVLDLVRLSPEPVFPPGRRGALPPDRAPHRPAAGAGGARRRLRTRHLHRVPRQHLRRGGPRRRRRPGADRGGGAARAARAASTSASTSSTPRWTTSRTRTASSTSPSVRSGWARSATRPPPCGSWRASPGPWAAWSSSSSSGPGNVDEAQHEDPRAAPRRPPAPARRVEAAPARRRRGRPPRGGLVRLLRPLPPRHRRAPFHDLAEIFSLRQKARHPPPRPAAAGAGAACAARSCASRRSTASSPASASSASR